MTDEMLRILVVDDEPGMRLGVTRALRDYRVDLPDIEDEVAFEVDQAETGEVAIEKIEAQVPDILLLDHKLPGMSGLDVLERLNEMKVEVLTVMITAYASLETAVTATKRGAYDFLAKPFTPQELKSAVRKASARVVLGRRAKALAEERRQVRFQFIRVLGHELKAPLAAIEGYLNIIKDRSAGDDPAAYDKMVDRSLVRLEGMRKLIMDLLDMTRIEAGQKMREVSPIDLTEIAQGSVETALPSAAERDITIELHDPGPIEMLGDRGEMEIVLNNLISNAVKYNRDGGRVDVRLTDDDENVTIQVADTGIGMTAEEKDKLFGEFVRIKNAKTRDILGSGLGLSILKKIIQMYEGSAEVESEPDVGSTFNVTLKRALQPSNAPAGPQDALTVAAGDEDADTTD
jgi:signal transduction histidine kinase